MDPRLLDRLWYGRDARATIVRALLAPLSWLYAAATRGRTALYDRGAFHQHRSAIPSISVGNLTAGGTGKTPIAAELARRLQERGAAPAIVLRGYGDDEPKVHETLNPEIPVVIAPDRVAGIAEARARGATVAVLDDAFQHRRAQRTADIVLLSADAWRPGRRRALPAGPWREPLSALRRADLAIVTRKAATDEQVAAVISAVTAAAPACSCAVARLAPDMLHRLDRGAERPIADLAGRSVLAIAAIGDPGAFVRQIERIGAVVQPMVFRDHHHFTPAQVRALAESAARSDVTVCTLKDAVKLASVWPRVAPPIWYVSQAVTFDVGETHVERLLDDVVSLSHRSPIT